MKKLYSQEAKDAVVAIGIITAFYGLMAMVSLIAW